MPLQTARPFFLPITRQLPYDLPLGRLPISFPLLTKLYELYCDPVNGNNMNGGSDTNPTAIYTSTNGSWDQTNRIFTPTDGTNPAAAGVKAGQCMSVYLDGATVPAYIQIVQTVENVANGRIFGNINFNNQATSPGTLGTGRSVKVGGAWKGPNGANAWPMASGNNWGALVGNPTLGGVRINFKNNATYSISAALPIGVNPGNGIIQGYTDTPGDGGKATIDGGTNAINLFNSSGWNGIVRDFIFSNNGTTGTNALINVSSAAALWWGCVFHDSRGTAANAPGCYYECEFYNINTSATAGLGCISAASTSFPITVINCYFHDCNAAGTYGIVSNTGGSCPCVYAFNSIFDTINQSGIYLGLSQQYIIIGCDFYNCGVSGIKNAMPNAAAWCLILNNNFLANGQYGIDTYVDATHGGHFLVIANNRYGNGIYRNRSGNINAQSFQSGTGQSTPLGGLLTLSAMFESGTDSYGDGVSPYNALATGDFSLVSDKAISKGRGFFTQTGSGKSGTRGYPDVGAAQAPTGLQVLGGSVVDIQTLPYGYVGYFYGWKWAFTQDAIVSVQSGTMPPGLSMVQVTPKIINIIGTPTTPGVYDFVLRSTVGASYSDAPFEIAIYADPNVGESGFASSV